MDSSQPSRQQLTVPEASAASSRLPSGAQAIAVTVSSRQSAARGVCVCFGCQSKICVSSAPEARTG